MFEVKTSVRDFTVIRVKCSFMFRVVNVKVFVISFGGFGVWLLFPNQTFSGDSTTRGSVQRTPHLLPLLGHDQRQSLRHQHIKLMNSW